MSPFLIASCMPLRRARSCVCAGSSVVELCDRAGREMHRSSRSVVKCFMVVVGLESCGSGLDRLRKRRDPLEVVDHFAIVRAETLGAVLRTPDLASFGLEIAMCEYPAHSQVY